MRKKNSQKKPKIIDITNDLNIPSAYRNKLKPRSDNQKDYIRTIAENTITFCQGVAGSGKTHIAIGMALEYLLDEKVKKIIITRPVVESGEKIGYLPGPQPLDAKIVTPNGFKLMGELKIGDLVISRDGKPTRVTNIYPKGEKEVYKITTSDGRSTECCLDHLWYTQTWEEHKRGKSGSIKTTQEIIDTLKTKKNRLNHYLPNCETVIYEKQNLPLSPYVLGVLLGDGSLSNSIGFTCADTEIAEKVNKELINMKCYVTKTKNRISYNIRSQLFNNKPAKKIKLTNTVNSDEQIFSSIGQAVQTLRLNKAKLEQLCSKNSIKDNIQYTFLEKDKDLNFTNPIKNIINNLGLLGKKACDKFIPSIYKISSVEDRIELLRGLMDTDGTIKASSGEYSFCTTSQQLADDIIEVVRSLGGKATIRSRNRIGKKSFYNNRIIKTKKVSYEFNISLPDGMNPFYLPRKANQVKKTYPKREKIKILSIEKVGSKVVQCIKVENNEHLYLTDDFIVTHNTAEEKLHPYLLPLLDEVNHFIPASYYSSLKTNNKIEIVPLGLMRGRNFHNSFIVADECQNASYDQLKMLLTRIGRESKMILTGDTSQSDLHKHMQGGFYDMIHALDNMDDIGISKLDSSDIVRNPIIGKIISRLDNYEYERSQK